MEQRGQPKSTLSVVASARAGYGRHRAAGDQAVRYGQTSRYRSVQQGRIQVASSTGVPLGSKFRKVNAYSLKISKPCHYIYDILHLENAMLIESDVRSLDGVCCSSSTAPEVMLP